MFYGEGEERFHLVAARDLRLLSVLTEKTVSDNRKDEKASGTRKLLTRR